MDTNVSLPKQSSRILALDILRGITIAGMILVNNPGSWSSIYTPLGHASWHGLTPTDLVFPFFMFIMGISTFISLRKSNFKASKASVLKVVKRTVVIFLIGIFLAWFGLSMSTYHKLAPEGLSIWSRLFAAVTNFENIRIMGVMQRLALTYGITALLAMFVKHKYFPYIIVSILISYFFILLFGDGFESAENQGSIVYIIDKAILGASHLYRSGAVVDPEGLVSTIPAIAHVMIGFCCGKFLVEINDNHSRIEKLFIIGTILTFTGFLLSYGCPINKALWTPTYVLVTCGLGSLFLALLIWIIDIKGKKGWTPFFEAFGVNPLFIYVFAGVFSRILADTRLPIDGSFKPLKSIYFDTVLSPYLEPHLASFLYAVTFIVITWLVANVLYKRKIYIKI